MRHTVAIVLGGFLALLVLGAAVVLWAMTGPDRTEASSPPAAETSPPGAGMSGEAMRRRLWQEPPRDAPGEAPLIDGERSRRPPSEAAGSPPAVRSRELIQVRIPEQEANRLITSAPEVRQALEQHQLHSLQIRFVPGYIIATARRPMWFGLDARVTATGTMQAAGDRIELDVTEVSLGNWPAPGGLQRDLEAELQVAVDRLNQRLGERVRIEEVRITDDALIASVQPSGTR